MLRDLFGDDLDLFRSYCEEGFHIRHGYDTPEDMWEANPTIQFS